MNRNSDHGTRIALLEQSHRENREVLKKMAEDMARIAHAVAAQAEDRSALVRAFAQLEAHAKLIENISDRMDKHDKDSLQRVIDAQHSEIAASRAQKSRALGEFIRTVLVVVTGVVTGLVLYHFGVHG